MALEGVTLQINLAPTDLPHARWILPHQLRRWAAQVDEIVLTVDLHRSRGRYAASWRERLPGLRALVAGTCADSPNAREDVVDYAPAALARLGARYLGGATVPAKDRHGAPFLAYLHGLAAASHRHVLHMDSDMLFGGESTTWVAEAVALMAQRPEVLACNPLPGPPTPDGSLRSQTLDRDAHPGIAFRAPHLSTRIFLIDTHKLAERLCPLPLLRPSPARTAQSRLEGNPPFAPAEECISAAMVARGMVRVDLLGAGGGTWALHPPYRSALFYEGLPELIARIEAGDVPAAQRGRHDVDDSMVDWSSARRPRWRRLIDRARLIGSRIGASSPA